MNKIKNYFLAFSAAVLLLMVPACSSDSSEPVSLEGYWGTTDDSLPFQFEAEVTTAENTETETLTVYLILEGAKGLYWEGSVEYPETPTGEFSVNSIPNKEALNASIFGSGADEKSYTYVDETIRFDFQMMGLTYDVVLERQLPTI